jgi:hypothetical protein
MHSPRPKALCTSVVIERLREEVHHRRSRIIQALTAIQEELSREAAAFLDAQAPAGYPSTCFAWARVFLDGEQLWRLDCIVSKAGWPASLWVIDVFARELFR